MSPAKETRQSTTPQLRAINRDKRIVTLVFTDYSLDSWGTRIDPDGWDFEQFKKNPVICLQHDSYGHSDTMGLPIAKGLPESIRRSGDAWLIDVQFPETGKFPAADYAFDLLADGFLNACSVGFDPGNREVVEETDKDGTKQQVTIFRKQKLLEISIVTIPANDNALVQRAREKNREADVEQFRATAVKLDEAVKQEAAKIADQRQDLTLDGVKFIVIAADAEALKKAVEEVTKRWGYFTDKQPVNRAATKALEKFFKARGEEQPAEEVKAWERIAELVEAPPPEPAKPEPTKVEVKPEEEKKPEPPAPTAPTTTDPAPEAPRQQEAPAERSMSISDLKALPAAFSDHVLTAVRESLERGEAKKFIPQVVEKAGKEFLTSFFSHSS